MFSTPSSDRYETGQGSKKGPVPNKWSLWLTLTDLMIFISICLPQNKGYWLLVFYTWDKISFKIHPSYSMWINVTYLWNEFRRWWKQCNPTPSCKDISKTSIVKPHPSLIHRMTEIIGVGEGLWKSHVLQDKKKTTFPGVTWKELWISALSWPTVSAGWALLMSVWGKSGQGLHGHGPAPDWPLASVIFSATVSSSDNRDSSRRVIFKYARIISLLLGSWMHCQNILKLWSMSSVFFPLKIFNNFFFHISWK